MPEVLTSELVRRNAQELLAMQEHEKRRLQRLLRRARLEIAGRLLETDAETFTAQQLRSVMVQVEASLRVLVREWSADGERLVTDAMDAGSQALLAEIAEFEPRFRGGAQQRIRLDAARRLSAHGALLLDQHQASASAYGSHVRRLAADRLAVHMVQNSKWHDMVRDIAGPKGLLAGERWRAERIVRTEVFGAANAGRYAGIEAAAEELPGLRMQWDSHLDGRTSATCRELNGRVRKVGEPFGSVRGRPLMHPPALPNCRSIVVAWHPDWMKEEADV